MDQSFGAQLRGFRQAVGLTQRDLAELAGLTDQAIRLLERGDRRYPQRATLTRIMDALQLDEPTRAAFLEAAPKRGQDSPRPAAIAMSGPRWKVSEQVPPVPAHFSGRRVEFERASTALTTSPNTPGSARVVTIQGMAGVGKSALAAAIAAEVTDQFPDGRLYLDLGGFGTAAPLRDDEAIYSLLRATGLTDSGLPASAVEAGSLLRTRLSDRRVLLVLDNATGIEQVKPLLPATPTCAVLVLSRVWLTGLPASCHLQLEVLEEDESLQLLRSIAGADRVDAEPAAAAELIDTCAGLPLAIRIAAGRLVAQPGWQVKDLVDRLRNQQHRIDELALDDIGVRASLAVSFSRDADDRAGGLSEKAFAALGLIDDTGLTTAAAARLLGTDQPQARDLLEGMVDAHVLMSSAPDRYRLHDLLHLYARELADQVLPPAQQNQALDRLLDLYETMAWRATRLIEPMSPRLRWEKADDCAIEPAVTEPSQVTEWLTAEHASIIKLVTQLAAAKVDRLAGLTVGLTTYFIGCGRFIDQVTVTRRALEVVTRPDLRAILQCDLGIAEAELGQSDQALNHFELAISGFRDVDHPAGEATALNNAARMLVERGRFGDAIELADRALKLNQAIGETHGISLSLTNLGVSYCMQGEFQTGYDYFARSLTICTEAGSQTGRALALHNIGCAAMDLGRVDEAITTLEQSADLTRVTGMHTSLCNVLIDLTDFHRRREDHDKAVACATEALHLATSADDQGRQARIHFQLGDLYAEAADPDAAREHLDFALTYYATRNEAAAQRVRQVLDCLTPV